MVKVLIPGGSDSPCWHRLVRIGREGKPIEDGRIPQLDGDSADWVCLVPTAIFEGSTWARMRVELARAARFFVVEVKRGDTSSVVAAMRDGAFDVVTEADGDDRWREALESAGISQALWLQLYAGRLDVEGARLVGRGKAMTTLRRDLERLGPTDVTVLILGESGAGKERVAAALHEAGRGGPLVTLNCAAMPRELMEAELFGAEKGAFTGAIKSRLGLVEQANGGTLFLDEIGELDLMLQPKLLRFLETRRARRVGGEGEYAVRVRMVAATNRDLALEVQEGRFRADLYYRLAEVVMPIPPLRARKEDIPDLARAFVEGANERFGKNIQSLEPGLVLKLQEYDWPGNVRELKSVIDRLVLFHDGPMLRSGWWEPPVGRVQAGPVSMVSVTSGDGSENGPVVAVVRGGLAEAGGFESLPSRTARRDLARRLLDEGKFSLAEVAARVGVHPTTLFRWRKGEKV
jgi:two-component system response regulator AtoC